MGMLSRFADIMSASVESVLSKAEGKNADKLLEKYLRDARESLSQVKAETAGIIAEETGVKRKLDELKAEISKYEGYAVAAVKAGNDDDARKFLTHVESLNPKLTDLEQAYELARENSEKMRQMTKRLMEDIGKSEAKLADLKRQLNVAKQQEKINKINEKVGNVNFGNADSLMDAVQKRIDAANAAAQLNDDLAPDSDLRELEARYAKQASSGSSVEERLAQLKAQQNPTGSSVEDRLAQLKDELD